jgi:alginate O-acetyltransferase complex protein AlgI
MLASTVVDWLAGLAIARPGATPRARKQALVWSVVANLGMLGFFKYFVFAQENLNRLLAALGEEPFAVFEVVLPVGISFYTFQSMSYTIDLYRGDAERARTLTDFTCYVALFPQLVAGPIVRYGSIAKQLRERPERGELFVEGAYAFMVGFTKKVLLANTIAEAAEIVFDEGAALAPHAAWFGLAAWTFQAYFDFSGYSDMAIGLGKMFGFELPDNFRSPYRAKSFTEFWQRWHITLSTWLRDYLYIPLGGNRKGPARTYFNLLVTMLACGFWHGAEWKYVAFGAAQGAMLIAERFRRRPLWYFLPVPLQVFLFMLTFQFTWVVYRPADLVEGRTFLGAMFTGTGAEAARAITSARLYTPWFIASMIACATVVWAGVETPRYVRAAMKSTWLTLFVLAGFAWSVLAMFAQAENPFLYFQF